MKSTYKKSKFHLKKNHKPKFTTSKSKIAILFRQLHDIVRWLSAGFVNQYPTTLLSELKVLTTRLSRICKDHGDLYTLDIIKECRRSLSQYLSGTKSNSKVIRLTYDGIPVLLGDLIPVIRGKERTVILPFLYTFLTSTRSLRLGTSPDIRPITDENSLPNGIVNFKDENNKYLKRFWSELGYRPSKTVPKAVRWKEFHMTSKSGPTGHALKFSLHELYILPSNLIKDLETCGGMKFSTTIHELKSLPSELRSELVPFTKKTCYRKITSFPDKENKVRVIAILDYWSQTVLKPLHDYLNHVLKRITQDCTYDQAGFWNKIKDSKVFYSVDLTAATDRFPIEIIKFVLKGKFPASYVESWSNIMVGHPFDYLNTSIRYAVGNPMGAYSSWASFAVAHHFVVYSCIKSLGLRWSDVPYCLLGDDIVIGNKEVAELYILRIKSLGIEISESKTHISSVFCEFAKRLIYKGQEITPFPISSLKETVKRSFLLTGLIIDTKKKGWIPKDSVPSCVGLYYEMVKHYNSRRRKVVISTSLFTELVMTMTNDSEQAPNILKDFLGSHCRLTHRTCNLNDSKRIIRMTLVEVACKSMKELSEKDKGSEPFGTLKTRYLDTINSYIERDLLSVDLSYSSFPVYHLTDKVLKTIDGFYPKIKEKLIFMGSLKELLKVITFPSNDKIFSQRSYYRTLGAAAYISKELKKQIDKLKTH